MPVDPELQPMLEVMNGGPPLRDVPLALLREGSPIPVPPPPPVAKVVNRRIPRSSGDLPVRIYYPRAGSDLPALVFFHGGGFVLGNLESHDSLLRSVALGADCIVVSVDYRLAPEHPFPAAADDALDSVEWVHAQAAEIGIDRTRIAVGGDSAGGNLATVATLRLREKKGPKLCGQLLIYPVTRLRGPLTGSLVTNGEGYFLRTIDMTWFEDQYIGDTEAATHPHGSPLLAEDLSRLPPAFVLTAEFDPLLDQGRDYALRLRQAGNECSYSHHAGAFHGFFGMPAEIGRRAVAEACAWLKASFAPR